jgi:hypothetical protein
MKKLVLENLNLNPEDMLNREHLKTIFGGYGGYGGGGGSCDSNCGGSRPKCAEGMVCESFTFYDCPSSVHKCVVKPG